MSEIETGGPAFPCDHLVDEDGIGLATGMTLRDYFAAKAMQSFLQTAPHGTVFGADGKSTNALYAGVSYLMADAMLAARSKA